MTPIYYEKTKQKHAYGSGEKTCLQTALHTVSKTPLQRHTHTTNTHTHNTTHTTTPTLKHINIRTQVTKQQTLLALYVHTGLHCKASALLTIKCKHKIIVKDCKAIGLFKDIVSLWRPHNWDTNCQLRSGAAIPISESHITMASKPIPPHMREQRNSAKFSTEKISDKKRRIQIPFFANTGLPMQSRAP